MRRSPPAEKPLDRVVGDHPLPDDHGADKHARGTVLVVGGSLRTPGAAILAGRAALAVGAGRLQIATEPSIAPAIGVAVPESISLGWNEIADQLTAVDAVVVGPGLLDEALAADLLGTVLALAADHAVVVIDALAIQVFANTGGATAGRPVVLTPNRRELHQLEPDVPDGEQARSTADRFGVVVVSFQTVTEPDGQTWIDDTRVSGLGTSGSGDVLAGLAGGVGARTGDATAAACWAALVHRRAGTLLAAEIGPVGYRAGQLVDAAPRVLADVDGPPSR